jgi:hypothetical protein
MSVIKDDDQERLDRIEHLLQKLQRELADIREEKRVSAEQMRDDAAFVERRVVRLTGSAIAAQRRAADRQVRTARRIGRKKR